MTDRAKLIGWAYVETPSFIPLKPKQFKVLSFELIP